MNRHIEKERRRKKEESSYRFSNRALKRRDLGHDFETEETPSGWLKADLHLHTRDDPSDGGHLVTHSAETLIERAAAQHFDVLAITNHHQLLFSDDLQAYAEKRGILLIPAVEATLENRHVLLYNFLEFRTSWRTLDLVSRRKTDRQLVIAPHPFFPIQTALKEKFLEYRELFDAVEISSLAVPGLGFNQRAREAAEDHSLPLVGNSDLHFLYQLGRAYSLIQAEKNRESVIDAIRKGRVRPVVNGEKEVRYILRWVGRMMRQRVRHALSG